MRRHSGSEPRSRHAAGGVYRRAGHGARSFSGYADITQIVAREEEQIPGEGIIPRTITPPLFAESIRAPIVVDALPALPDGDHPEGSLVFLTTDGKLYRNVADAWTAAVATSDLSGTITETQIADNAISTPKLQANAVTAAKIAANTITAGQIAADTITAGQIAAGAIGADEIAANAVVAEKIDAHSIGADKLAIGGAYGNLIKNPSFEAGDSSVLVDSGGPTVAIADSERLLRGWLVVSDATRVRFQTSANVRTGSRIGVLVVSDGQASLRLYQDIPVVAGRTYRVTGWHWKGASGGVTSRLRVNRLDAAKSVVAFNSFSSDTTSSTPQFADGVVTVPSDGSTSFLRVELLANGTVSGSDQVFAFEDVALVEAPANVRNTTGEVLIDSSGVTIINGKLTFADSYGSTAMDGTGFGAEWVGFIRSGFYNGSFTRGSTSDIPVSEVGGGSGMANYLASLTALLPNWVVASSGGNLRQVADSTAAHGVALRSAATASGQTDRWYQDVPVTPSKKYIVRCNEKWTGTVDFVRAQYYSWRDANHAIIGSRISSGLLYTSAQSTYVVNVDHAGAIIGAAPANAVYLRVEVEITHNNATTTYQLSDISLVESTQDRAFRGVDVVRTTAQSIANNTPTNISFNSEQIDTEGMFAPTSADVTIRVSGVYRITASATFAASTGGTRRIVAITLNGSAPIGGEQTIVTGGNNFDMHASATLVMYLAVGYIVRTNVHQNSGAALNVTQARMSVELLGV